MTVVVFVEQTLVNVFECVSEVIGHSLLELFGVLDVKEVTILTQILFEKLRHFKLDIIGDLVSIQTVPITDTKQVEPLMPTHVRGQSVGVLVHFVRVARLVPTRCGEGKLRD